MAGAGPDLTGERGIAAAYGAHGAEIYRFVLRGLGDVGSAQDAVQETFLRAWQAAHRYDPDRGSLRVWLFAIARNVMIDASRRRGRTTWPALPGQEQSVLEAVPPTRDPSEDVLNRTVVERALDDLSREHRHVIVETYLRGRSYDEVSTECGVPVGTLRSRTFYALKALRGALAETTAESDDEEGGAR